MPKNWFELSFDEQRGPREPYMQQPHIDAVKRMNARGGWASVRDAVAWVLDRKAPTAWFYIVEYAKDEDGRQYRVGGCSLDEAEESQYTSLDF